MKRRSAPTKGPWTWGSGKNFTFHHWHHDWGGYQGLVGLSTLRQYKQINITDEEWIQCNRKGSEHSQIMLEEFPGQGASSKPSKNRPYPAIVNTETCRLNKRTISGNENERRCKIKSASSKKIKWYVRTDKDLTGRHVQSSELWRQTNKTEVEWRQLILVQITNRTPASRQANYTVFRKKHPLTFSFISPCIMYRFKQKLQWIYPRTGRFWQCKNYIFIAADDVIMTSHL